MRSLDKKLFRDLTHMKGQAIAVGLVVMCGIASFVTSWTAFRSLSITQETYYGTSRFSFIFAHAKRAPESILPRIESIPGVAVVQPRIVFDVTLDIPGLEEPATGRLLSIPGRRRDILNDVVLMSGRWIEPDHPDEIIMSKPLAEANGLEPGDSVGAVVNGRWRDLQIVGTGLSPEFMYEIRSSDLFPDRRRFGVLWMNHDALGYAFDMDGGFNDLVLSVSPEADTREIIARIDEILEPWGGTGSYDRERQISHRFISDEIRGNRISGTYIPSIFLGVAAFLIHITLQRLVQTQRDQIAILKAFGYSNVDIGIHFLEFGLIIVLAGAAIGVALGVWLSRGVAALYMSFYNFPELTLDVSLGTVFASLLVAALAAILGALSAVRSAVILPPAEAMRPEAPPMFKKGFIERSGMLENVSTASKIIVRNIARRRMKSFLSVLGVALAVGILVVGRFMFDSIDTMMDFQFRRIQREDVAVSFHLPRPMFAVSDLYHLPGVMRVEPYRAVPVRLRHGHRSHLTAIMGINQGTRLRRIIDDEGRGVELPPEGLVLNDELARILDAKEGDEIVVEVLDGARPKGTVRVARTVNEFIGVTAYMNARALSDFVGESPSMSGAWLQVDDRKAEDLYRLLKETPAVAGVSLRETMVQSFEETIAQSMGATTTILVTFACVIAIGVIYNGARIALSERGRELASLRVLGFTRKEVGAMLLGEQAILTLAAIPFGFGIGYFFASLIVNAMSSEMYRFPLVITGETYAFSFGVVVVSAIGSSILIYRRIRTLDLVEVLKTRE